MPDGVDVPYKINPLEVDTASVIPAVLAIEYVVGVKFTNGIYIALDGVVVTVADTINPVTTVEAVQEEVTIAPLPVSGAKSV